MNWKSFFVNGISVFLGLIFFTSGMAKVYFGHKFPGLIGPVWLEAELTKYDLGMFARFIAFSQITIGFILLTLRYRTIGAIMLLPMVLNILLITVSMNWAGTPYVLSFFLMLNIILLVADAKKLLPLLGFHPQEALVYKTDSSPILFGLIWLVGFSLVLLSTYLSFSHLILAYSFCIAGVVVSLFPYFKAGRAGRLVVSNHKIVPEHQLV